MNTFQILNTSAAFLISVSRVEPEWLSEAERAAILGLQDDLVTHEQAPLVGPRILMQSILGTRGKLLAELEAKIRKVLPGKSLLELECSVDDGQLGWWAAGANHAAIRRQVEAVLNEARDRLAGECWQLLLHQAAQDSPLLLLGAGGQLMDILAENDFIEIVIRLSAEEREEFMRAAAVEQLPGLSGQYQLKSNGFQILQFRSVEAAQSALKHLKEIAQLCSISERDIGPWKVFTGRSNQQAAFELRVTIERRRELDRAFIKFRSEQDAVGALIHLSGQMLAVKSSKSPGQTEYLTIQLNKKDDKTSLFCWLKDRNSPYRKAVTEEHLLEAVRRLGLDPVQVRIPKEKEYASSQEEQEMVREDISRVFTDSWTCTKADFSINLRKTNPKDFTWVAWLRFKSSAAGLRCARYCEVQTSFGILFNVQMFLNN
jgi:hypothetical protein